MSTAEAISLIATIVLLLTTITGWIFTYRAQLAIQKSQVTASRDLASLQDMLVFYREQTQTLVREKLAALQEIADWVEEGRSIYLDCLTEHEKDGNVIRPSFTLEEQQAISARVGKLRARAPRYYYLARLWDPLAETASEWQWGTFSAPIDLAQIISAYENEVLDQFAEAFLGPEARIHPYIDDQFYGLHEAAVRAIERLKQHVALRAEETKAA